MIAGNRPGGVFDKRGQKALDEGYRRFVFDSVPPSWGHGLVLLAQGRGYGLVMQEFVEHSRMRLWAKIDTSSIR